MGNKKIKLFATLLLLAVFSALHAQEAVLVTGGNASGSGGSLSYSVGQVVYTTNTGANGSVAQGVQQPFEISIVTGLEEAKGIKVQYSVYPNPSNGIVMLKIESSAILSIHTLLYQLYDNNGKLMEKKIIDSDETSINMSNLVSATYFLKVIQNEKELQIFKIIKN